MYSTSRIANFAHGTTVTAAGYGAYFFFQTLHLPFWVAALAGIALAALVGVLSFRFVFTPLVKRHSAKTVLLIAGVGLLLLFENAVLLLFGADVKSFRLIPVARGKEIFGAIITPLQMWILGVVAVILVLFFFWMRKTKSGRTLKAVADSPELSVVLGIPVVRIQETAVLIGSIIAGIGGILIGLEQNLETTMGTHLIVKGFTGSVVGGIQSLPGSILGSYLVGMVENYGIWYLASGWKDAIAFLLLFVFLLFRPYGILGVKKTREERI